MGGYRYTNPAKWKSQRWYRRLDPFQKITWEYINGTCNECGMWQVCWPDLMDDLLIPEPFSLFNFVAACNRDFNNVTGETYEIDRLILFENNTRLFITTYVQEQHDFGRPNVNPAGNFAKAALKKLAEYGLLGEALCQGWLTLTIPLPTLLNHSEALVNPMLKTDKGWLTPSISYSNRDKNLLTALNIGEPGDSKGVKGGKKGEPPPETEVIAPPDEPYTPEVVPDAVKKSFCHKVTARFKHHFPNYPLNPKLDNPAALQIGYNIAVEKGWHKESIFNGKTSETMAELEDILEWAKLDDWFPTRSLSDYVKEWQRLQQKRYNGNTPVGRAQKTHAGQVTQGGHGSL